MGRKVIIRSLQGELGDFKFRANWFPGDYLPTEDIKRFLNEIDVLNHAENPLQYGVLDNKLSLEERLVFLKESIWCRIHYKDKPVGFVYMVDLGNVNNKPVIHFGLVKQVGRIGKEAIALPYVVLGLGNLINFGPHMATNVSHVPIIIEMFGEMAHATYPTFEQQDPVLRQRYQPALELLTKTYLTPVLNYNDKFICNRTFKVLNGLATSESGFESQWRSVPKSNITLCNVFMKEWLNVRQNEQGELCVLDDLIQIGEVDFRFVGQPRPQQVLNAVRFIGLQRADDRNDEDTNVVELLKMGA